MLPEKTIRVLVVDDSIVFREVLSKGMSSDKKIEVVAVADDPFDAKEKIIRYKPDVMTCDVEMPKMNGIEFIKMLMPQYPLPVIVVSSLSGVVFDAMNAGAVDFVAKPDISSVNSVENFIYEMIEKIKIASMAKVMRKKSGTIADSNTSKHTYAENKIIAIGASTGGTDAIFQVIKELHKDTPGIVVVQHIPPVFSRMFAERLNKTTSLTAREAVTGDVVEKGKVLVAPGDQHMKIVRVGDQYKVHCYSGDKVNGHCPSVDILFESVAKEAGKNAIGVILTGMGYDGAKGMLSMKRNGARTIGQNEESCVVYGMPKVAFNLGAVEKQVSLDNIPQVIYRMLE